MNHSSAFLELNLELFLALLLEKVEDVTTSYVSRK